MKDGFGDTSAITDCSGLKGIDDDIRRAANALMRQQREDGHWVFELEADATIPAEYILLRQYLGERDEPELERKVGVYLRRIQGEHGGWSLFHGGAFDISASVKAYFCLKIIGDSPDASHMAKARAAILAHGGAEQANVFTRIMLAQFDELSWAHVPTMPVEMVLLPRWFPIHLSRMSYWARVVIMPLIVLAAVRVRARNPRKVRIQELFVTTRPTAHNAPAHQHRGWALLFNTLDRVLKVAEPLWPKFLRRRAIERSAGPPCSSHCPPGDREAAGDPRGRGLLPAVRFSCLGYCAGQPGVDGSAGRRRDCGRSERIGLVATAPGVGGERGLGRATSGCASRWLGFPIPQRALSGS
jgi:squalene-hopene/tetraprenyl-beta-curcumene cyclase